MEKPAQITLVWGLFGQGVPKSHIAKHLGRDRETIIDWPRGVQEQGLAAYLDQHPWQAHQPRPSRQVRTSTKRLVWAIRERKHGC